MKHTESELIWHYTTFESLFHILSSKSLLAKHFRQLNDTTEMMVAEKTSVKHIYDLGDPRGIELANSEDFRTKLRNPVFPYVISFSKAGDRLAMWRAYGGAIDRNDGVAIGFSTEDLALLCDHYVGYGPVDCVYNDNNLLKWLKYWVENPEIADEEDLSTDFFVHALRRKHRTFREEEECRIVISNTIICKEKGLNFKEADSQAEILRPYLPLTTNAEKTETSALEFPLGIKCLRAGPKASLERLKLYAKLLPLSGKVTIDKSQIPFR